MDMSGPYYVQCISGNPLHVREAIAGTPLEAKCKAREAAGYLDALCLDSSECPSCIEDDKQELRRYDLFGCPLTVIGDDCTKSCHCRQVMQDVSPYDDQVRHVQDVA